jgi:hypothetical protein
MSRKSNQSEENQFETLNELDVNSTEALPSILTKKNIALLFTGTAAIFGSTGFFAYRQLAMAPKEVTPATCQIQEVYQKQRSESENTLVARQKANIQKATENKKPVEEAKVLGTISELEMRAIQADTIGLNIKDKKNISHFTSNFNKILNIIDKENILSGYEQMKLFSWYLTHSEDVASLDGSWSSESAELTKFVDEFNTESENLRKLTFTSLSQENCKTKPVAKFSKTGNPTVDEKINIDIVSALVQEESKFQQNKTSPLSLAEQAFNRQKKEIREQNIVIVEENKKLSKDQQKPLIKQPSFPMTNSEGVNNGRGQARMDAAKRDPSPNESEQLARILLNISTFVSPDRTLNESRLQRILTRLEVYNTDQKYSTLKTVEDFQENLRLLANEVVSIDSEIAHEKKLAKQNVDQYNLYLGLTALGGIATLAVGGFAVKKTLSLRKANKKIDVMEEEAISGNTESTAVTALTGRLTQKDSKITQLEEAVIDAGRIKTGEDEDGNPIFSDVSEIDPITAEKSTSLKGLVDQFVTNRPELAREVIQGVLNENPSFIDTVSVLSYEDLKLKLKTLSEKIIGDTEANIYTQIDDILVFLHLLEDKISFTVNSDLMNFGVNQNYDLLKVIADKHKTYLEYIPSLRKILNNFKSDINGLKDKIRLDALEKQYLLRIEELSNSIPRELGIVPVLPEASKIELSKDRINHIKKILSGEDFKKLESTTNLINSKVLKYWLESQNSDFDSFEFAMSEYLIGRPETKEEIDVNKLKLKQVRALEKELIKKNHQFNKILNDFEIPDFELSLYYQSLIINTFSEKNKTVDLKDHSTGTAIFIDLLNKQIPQKVIRDYKTIDKIVEQKTGLLESAVKIGDTVVQTISDFRQINLGEVAASIKKEGLKGSISKVTSIIKNWSIENKLTSEKKDDLSVSEKILSISNKFEMLHLALLKGSQNTSDEINQYRLDIVAPICKLSRDLVAFEFNNVNRLDTAMELLNKIEEENDKDKCRLLIEEFNQFNKSLKTEHSLLDVLFELDTIVQQSSKSFEKTKDSTNEKVTQNIIVDTNKNIISLTSIFSKIEETL